MQLDPRLFVSEPESQNRKAELDVLGAAVDDRGKIATFTQVVNISPETLKKQEPVIWHQQLIVPPGLYQVRLAVRDRELGRTGSAMEWIEVPDLAQPRLEMSSLFIAERSGIESQVDPESPQPVTVSVDHEFSSGSVLRFQTYIYNATRSAEKNSPEVEVRAEVLKNDSAVVTTPWAAVPVTAVNDHATLPYWSELPLDQFKPGRYVLRVTAVDRVTKRSVSQLINFTIVN
jgi:hypothetical protein